MGEVYRARDTRLGRDVAIKVLPAEFADDPERLRRFEQEARAVAALSHPNVLALFDVGSAIVSLRGAETPEAISAQTSGLPRLQSGLAVTEGEGEQVHFLVTELLEGESLRDRLKAGGLTVRKAVETALQIAQGIAAAHEKGIVHRDLKPENVFLTKDGVVKILDFGIAKLAAPRSLVDPVQANTVLEATEVGTTLGTVGYMAPEQIRGLSADHRSDIFAFGCVLYEMLSGRRAFLGDTPADTMTAILTKDLEPLSGTGRGIAPAVQKIVSRCLEKRPEDRFQSARDLAHDLSATMPDTSPARPGSVVASTRQWRVVGLALASVVVLAAAGVLVLKLKPAGPSDRATKPPKIVVLPFENLGAPEDAYFAAGMTEEITSRLANVQGLGVISRTSALEYTHRGKTVKEIGRELGVDYVLEGSVRWERGQGHESRVRITPQLIRVADDTHIWSDRYDRVLADVFAIQSEVAESAVTAMGVTLLPRERSALKEVSTNDLEAYDLYLRGQELDSRGLSRGDIEGALKMYQAAVDRDPRFAQAFAGLAKANLLMHWEYYDSSQGRLARARKAAEQAVELRPDLAETHTALGYYFYWGLLDYPRALSEFSVALKIEPNHTEALAGVAYVQRRQGRWGEAAETLSKVAELDPKNASRLFDVAIDCLTAGRYADADRACARTLSLSPQWARAYAERARVQLLWHGDVDKAQAVLDEAGRIAGLADEGGYLAQLRLWVVLARRDYQGALRQLRAETRGAIDNGERYSPISLLRGQVQTLVGQHDLARHSFETARLDLEQRVRRDPDDHRLHGSLGIAYAGLGRREDAVREAKLACDVMPASRDSLRAIGPVGNLAVVYTMVGQPGEAIATLDALLARSGWFSVRLLRLDPTWDPLRSDPRFQALLTKYEVKP